MLAVAPGFADPVHNSQRCFRAILDAMATPGSLHQIGALPSAPAPLNQAAASVLLTLVDADTRVWVDPTWDDARSWLTFHCGAPFAQAPEQAAFVVAGPETLERLEAGSDDFPEAGATLIWQPAALGSGAELVLNGPGLARPATLRVHPLPPGFVAAWAASRARYPRGVDVILCCGTTLAALPRTVTVG